MRKDDDAVEVLRCPFRNRDPALPLRHATRDALQREFPAEHNADWIDDVLITISELVQNVSQHTGGPGELIVTLAPGAVLIEVADSSTAIPQTRQPAPDRSGGRGLLLIEAASQQWGVRTGETGKVVWARMPAPSNSRPLHAA
ncbi:ATP-binding protein [Actinoplanes sp. NPDC051859]|uniref:ATP-binding protein n=1 Tax=Actinoplanes sp. NPDC051859 TaxID=3363909 RepID=UPI0037AD780E